MELKDIQALAVGTSVGFQPRIDGPVIPAIVMQNGPRKDPDGNPITYMNDLLVIQIGSGPGTVSWEPINHPDGIAQLVSAPA